MAESNVIAPIFRWANGWIADDVFTWINNSYFSSKNIEIREINCPQCDNLAIANYNDNKISIEIVISIWIFVICVILFSYFSSVNTFLVKITDLLFWTFYVFYSWQVEQIPLLWI